MEVLEAIRERRSIRAFKSDPVPKEVLRELLDICLRAPSWANTQPWEFVIIGGKVMEELKQILVVKRSDGVESNPDIPWPAFPDLYRERSRQLGFRLYETLGIAREDKQKRREHSLSMARFFGAPNGIIFYIDRALGSYSMFDVGILIQTIMLAALSYGLGTCCEAEVVQYADELRRLLGISESKLIVCGMAIGYPDTDALAYRFWSSREPLDTFATWHGL